LYYGGTSYDNQQGLGVQLKSGAERGEAVAAGKVDAPSVKRLGLTLVPTTVLYDRGTTFAPSALMHPRVPPWQVEFSAADAERMSIKDGDTVKLTVGEASALVRARVNGHAPEGVVLMPESLGAHVTSGAAKVAVSKA
jgi:NADH-quinone oxidoreductase subunit G